MAQHQNTWRDFSQIGLFAYKWENNAKNGDVFTLCHHGSAARWP
ncbi:hypothetical protein YPPY66_0187 [Yersinia pestis PY-66]|uniref:Uncharacterized protein n=2 Tax=Yersinia pestis TaxID=632 RepID=A0AB72ZKC1_YERPE|nr:hypothetical protein YpAngola_A2114 [Yersinia pestis Angola]AIN15061.1 hypothetical protein DJ40_392 [Yersinia pseudotuberculosis]AJI90037.1 hypothetical protein CH59_3721 [Yersinia pestis]AJI98001.1 hypothetical protein BZ18_2523 [Yersinia pestis Pestoides F]AJJ80708.1 hypothetical protein CH58_4188 [Yersinia pestis Antiqua]AJK11954.1 hypothetical protein CH60_2441 [Yersinia pestis str. Pestoides B]AJK24058.1 hypothetical protein CH43_2591 [Yersinia pestis Pestoides G]AKS58437.1 hypothet